MSLSTLTKVEIGGAVLIGLVLLYGAKKIADVLPAIDPSNPDNWVNTHVTDAYQGLTGSKGSIGTDLYDVLHPPAAAGTNVINGGATSFYQWATGSKGSIGGDIYDWFH